MDKRSGVASGLLEGNVAHEDMVEAVRMLNPSFMVNTVLNSDNEIVSAYAGHWYEAHLQGCAAYASAHTAPVRLSSAHKSNMNAQHNLIGLEPGVTLCAALGMAPTN